MCNLSIAFQMFLGEFTQSDKKTPQNNDLPLSDGKIISSPAPIKGRTADSVFFSSIQANTPCGFTFMCFYKYTSTEISVPLSARGRTSEWYSSPFTSTSLFSRLPL